MVIKTLAVGTTPIFSQSIFFIFSGICVPNLKTWNSCQMIRIKVTFNPSFFLFCTCYIFSKEVWQLCQQLRRSSCNTTCQNCQKYSALSTCNFVFQKLCLNFKHFPGPFLSSIYLLPRRNKSLILGNNYKH